MRLPPSSSTELLRSLWPSRTDDDVLRSWVASACDTSPGGRTVGDEAIERAKWALGCAVTIDRTLPHDGGLRVIDGQLSIQLSGRHGQYRRRFTIAHELGHASLYRLDETLDQADPGTERLCDLFAAELLVPQSLVRDLGRVGPYPWVLITLLKRTGASTHAVGIAMWRYLHAAAGIATDTGEIVTAHATANLPPLALESELKRLARDPRVGFAAARLSRVWQLEMLRAGTRVAFAVRPVPTGR